MRRALGAGTLERRPSGKWRFRICGPDGKRRTSPTYATREEAQRVLDAALYELAGGGMAPVGAVTLAGYGEAWLARRTVRSAADERSLWGRHVAGTPLSAMPLAEIRRRHIRDFFAELARKRKWVAKRGGERGERVASDECLSPQTVKLVFALLHRMLNEAIVDEIITTNPAHGHRLPRQEADADAEDKWTFLAADEIELLLACEEIPEKARSVYEVAIFTGMRQGELWGLRWGDLSLDAERPECVVRRSYEGPTKAGKPRRFPLLQRAVDAFQRIREGAADVSPSALVFPNPSGGMHGGGYDAGWAARNREKAGIREDVKFHSFRHTCASHLLVGTWGHAWSLAEVRDYLGHSSISVTERYAHLAPGRLAELAARTSGGGRTGGGGDGGGTSGGTTGGDAGGSQRRENGAEDASFLNSRSRVRIAPRSPTKAVRCLRGGKAPLFRSCQPRVAIGLMIGPVNLSAHGELAGTEIEPPRRDSYHGRSLSKECPCVRVRRNA